MKMTHVHAVIETFKDQPIFTIRDIRIFLTPRKVSKLYPKLLLHTLIKKGKLNQITKGVYTFQQDPIVSGFAFKTFYYGLHFALTHHHIWDQATNLVIVTPKKVRSGMRTLMGSRAIVRRIHRKLFFGYDLVPHYQYWIPVSDVEKTFLDLIYFRQQFQTEIWRKLIQKSKKTTLKKYLAHYPKWVQKRARKMLTA